MRRAFWVAIVGLSCLVLGQNPLGAQTKVLRVLKGHTGEVRAIDYSPDGKLLVSCAEDGTLRLWNTETGAEQKSFKQAADFVRFLRDGKTILAQLKADFGRPRPFVLVDSQTGKLKLDLSTLVTNPNQRYLRGVAELADGSLMASSSTELSRWKLAGGKMSGVKFEKMWKFTEERSSLVLVASPDGSRLSTDDNLLWDVAAGKPIPREDDKVAGSGRRIAFSHDSKLLTGVTDGPVGDLYLWDSAIGKRLWKVELGAYGACSVAFSPNDEVIAVGGLNKLNLYATKDGKQLHELPLNRFPNEAVFSPDGQQLAEAGNEKTIQIWDVSGLALGPKKTK